MLFLYYVLVVSLFSALVPAVPIPIGQVLRFGNYPYFLAAGEWTRPPAEKDRPINKLAWTVSFSSNNMWGIKQRGLEVKLFNGGKLKPGEPASKSYEWYDLTDEATPEVLGTWVRESTGSVIEIVKYYHKELWATLIDFKIIKEGTGKWAEQSAKEEEENKHRHDGH